LTLWQWLLGPPRRHCGLDMMAHQAAPEQAEIKQHKGSRVLHLNDQEIGVADCSDGKVQLVDTQVVTPVHELGWRSKQEAKRFEPVFELDGSHGAGPGVSYWSTKQLA
jgi:hypothetical protein